MQLFQLDLKLDFEMAFVKVEQCTPLEAVIKLYSLDPEVVKQQCKKELKIIPLHDVISSNATKDISFRTKDKSGKREIKRQQELQILKACMKLAEEKVGEHGRVSAVYR